MVVARPLQDFRIAEVVAEALVGADDARPVQRGRARARIVVGIEAGLEGAEKARRDVAELDRPPAPALVVAGIETGRAGPEAPGPQGPGPRPGGRVMAGRERLGGAAGVVERGEGGIRLSVLG